MNGQERSLSRIQMLSWNEQNETLGHIFGPTELISNTQRLLYGLCLEQKCPESSSEREDKSLGPWGRFRENDKN